MGSLSVLRVLLLSSDPQNAAIVERALSARFDVRSAGSLREVLRNLRQSDWRTDVILADLNDAEAESRAALEHLRELAGATPVLVRNGLSTEALQHQLDMLAQIGEATPGDGLALMQLALHQQQLVQQAIASHRGQILAELDRIATVAAEAAVNRGIDQLLTRLGFDDPEGVRIAVRLGRAWEAAKVKFLSGIATGFASAFLLAMGAGIVALLKSNNAK